MDGLSNETLCKNGSHPRLESNDAIHESPKESLDHGFTIGIYISIIGCVTILGNSLVLAVFCKRKSFRCPTNFFILNLCVSDITFAAVANPLSAISSFYKRWMFHETGCQMYAFISCACSINTTMTHAAISYYRYKVICRRDYLNNVQSNSVTKVLAGIWIITLIWSAAPLTGWGSYALEPVPISCYINRQNTDLKDKIYICVYTTFVLISPLIFMIYVYRKIAINMKELFWTKREKSKVPVNFLSRYLIEIERRVTRVCFLITVLFLATWIPYVSVAVLTSFDVGVPDILNLLPMLNVKLSRSFNPFIYYFCNTKFRETICNLIMYCTHKKVAPIQVESNGTEMRKNRVFPYLATNCEHFGQCIKTQELVLQRTTGKESTDLPDPESKKATVSRISGLFITRTFAFGSQPFSKQSKDGRVATFTKI